MLEKQIEKLIDQTNYGKRKDKRIKDLWYALNRLVSVIDVYGNSIDHEADPEWIPPSWLRDGEYTIDMRLKDIRRNNQEIIDAENELRHLLFEDCDITHI